MMDWVEYSLGDDGWEHFREGFQHIRRELFIMINAEFTSYVLRQCSISHDYYKESSTYLLIFRISAQVGACRRKMRERRKYRCKGMSGCWV